MAKLSSIIGFFCLIGCIYQIYDMTQFYIQFKVRRDVAYDYAPFIEMPAIDITVPMAVAMNLTKLFAAYPEEMNSLCAQMNDTDAGLNYTTEDFQEKCEISMQKAPIVFSFRLFSFIKVKDIKEFSGDLNEQVKISFAKFGNYTDLCNSTRYYNGVAIFIRLICLNGTKPLSVHTNHVTLNEGVVAQLTHTFGTHFGIRFSNQTDLPVFEQGKYHIITREPGSFPFSSISFVKTVMSSLEYPYETNCRYYNKAKSIAKCMTEYSLGQPTPYLFKTLTHEWDQHPDHLGFLQPKIDQPEDDEITDRDDSEDENGYSTDLEVQEYNAIINCTEQATATECEKTHYLVEGENSDQTKSEFGVINIEFSRKANLYLSVHPVLPWSEYVIFIGSILGIWFGISIHDRTLSMLTYIVTRFCKIKTQTKRATKQRKTELNENQRPIQRKLQLKSMKKLPTFDGHHNYVRNIRLSKNSK